MYISGRIIGPEKTRLSERRKGQSPSEEEG